MKGKPGTLVYICPFSQFGNQGTQAGAELIADAVREMLADNQREKRPHRGSAYDQFVRFDELSLATKDEFADWRERAQSVAATVIKKAEFLLFVGGNHLSVLPIYEELAKHDRTLVVQFDAHLDVYHHLSDTAPELSHGNFIKELSYHRPPIVNIGNRDQFLKPDVIGKHFRAAHSNEDLVTNPQVVIEEIQSRINTASRVFIDIDWDVLDPAFFPAVVDALPFGMTPISLLSILKSIWSNKVIGVAMSEFDPGRDDRDRSLQLAMWLIEQILLWRYDG
jgi:agmatinase